MASLCIPILVPEMGNTLGAAFMGNIAAAIFYGITMLQMYIYYQRNQDGRLLKCLIFILWLLDSLHLVLITHAIYFYAITNFSNIVAMLDATWSILIHIIVTGISDFIVRGIFAYRVHRLSDGKIWLTAAITISSVLVFGCSIAFAIRGMQISAFTELTQISWILYTAFSAGVFADCVVAAALSVLLKQRRTGIKRTDSIVRVLVLYSINTGLLTSLCAIVVLITYATMPSNFVYIAFYFVLPKLFLNSLLATLNARKRLRTLNSNTANIVSIPLTSVLNRSSSKSGPSRHNSQHHVEIEVQTTVDRRTDSVADLQMSEGTFKHTYSHE